MSESAFPPDALCAVEGCGHRYDEHQNGLTMMDSRCFPCVTNRNRGFDVPTHHGFEPRILAGGALNASQEREAYLKAMRGE